MKLLPNCRHCLRDLLDPNLVNGKIVLYEGGGRESSPFDAGGVVFLTQGQTFICYIVFYPTWILPSVEGCCQCI